MKLEDIIPPLKLCKLIPTGEFEHSALVYFWLSPANKYIVTQRSATYCIPSIYPPCPCGMKYFYPAPTLQEILEDLHRHQEDVFLKWSETAYHEWLVNAYTHNKEDYQSHHKNIVVAAIKTWLEMKGSKE